MGPISPRTFQTQSEEKQPKKPNNTGTKTRILSTYATVRNTQQKNHKTIQQTKNTNIHQHHTTNHPKLNM